MKLTNVSSRYGAPMGRASDGAGNFADRTFYVRRVRLDSGGYDTGGAYWGHGEPLYVAWFRDEDGETVSHFMRAPNREAVIAALR